MTGIFCFRLSLSSTFCSGNFSQSFYTSAGHDYQLSFFISIVFFAFLPIVFLSSIFSFMLSLFFFPDSFWLSYFPDLAVIIRKQEQVLAWINIPSLKFFLAGFIGRIFYSFSCWDHTRALSALQVLNIHSVPVIKMRAFGYQFY